MANLALLQKYAPYIWLESEEEFFPTDVGNYLSAVDMIYTIIVPNLGPLNFPIIKQVTEDNVSEQSITSAAGVTTVSSFAADSNETSQFYLPITNAAIYAGTPLQNNNCVAPVYAAVLVDLDPKNPAPYTDLLYSFFYVYNGASMNDPGFYDTHEGDWEHVIVRLGMDGETVLGIYFQAHGSSDPYSQ